MSTKNLKTWIEVDPNSDFTIHNIPFGIYTDAKVEHHACSAIGDYIIDLFELESLDLLNINRSALAEKDLNAFIALGKTLTNGVRNKLIEILCDENSVLKTDKKWQQLNNLN